MTAAAPRLDLGDGFVLRPLAAGDAAALVRHANNPRVAAGLRGGFPSPYTPRDAEAWLEKVRNQDPVTSFAIASTEGLLGGIGLTLGEDVFRRTAEIGYWLGEPFWGRGIATRAVVALTEHAFAAFDLARVQAGVFASNPASGRVLEKAGFALEARLRRHATKGGRTMDLLVYARLRA